MFFKSKSHEEVSFLKKKIDELHNEIEEKNQEIDALNIKYTELKNNKPSVSFKTDKDFYDFIKWELDSKQDKCNKEIQIIEEKMIELETKNIELETKNRMYLDALNSIWFKVTLK